MALSSYDCGVRIEAVAGNVSIQDSVFHGGETAIECINDGALSLVQSSTFQDNGHGLVVGQGVGLVIGLSSFNDWQETGVDVESGSFPVVLDTTFNGAQEALRIPAWAIESLGASTSGNDFTQMAAGSWVAVRGDTITEELHWELLDTNVHYVVLGDIIYGARMRFAPGVRLEMESNVSIARKPNTNMAILALGTESAPVTFTAVGGQRWGTLHCGTLSSLEHVVVDQAGKGAVPSLVLKGKVTVRTVTVKNGLGDGVRQDQKKVNKVMKAPSLIDSCIFEDNVGHGLLCTEGVLVDAYGSWFTANGVSGVFADDGSLVCFVNLRECRITGNVGMAVNTNFLGQDSNVDARYCWWGLAGPGGSVGAGVEFDPWYTTDIDIYAMIDAEIGPTTFIPDASEARFYSTTPLGADWTLDIEDDQNVNVFSAAGPGTLIDVAWDGNNGGSPVPNGLYDFTLRAYDPSGPSESILVGTLDVDDNLLISQIATPDPLDMVNRGEDVVITGTANGAPAVFDKYILEYGIGSEPKTFTQIATSTTEVIDGVLGTLSLPLPGNDSVPYLTLRLRVLDVNSSEVVSTRLLRYFNLFNFKIKPGAFTPDGDGFEDLTYISGNVTWTSTWTLTISTVAPPGPPGSQGAQEIYYTETGPGTHFSFAWDGSNQINPAHSGTPGDYEAKLVAIPVGGSSSDEIQRLNTLSITEDTPAIRITSPAEDDIVAHNGTAGETTVLLTTNMNAGVPFTVDIDVGAPGAWQRIQTLTDTDFPSGEGTFNWDPGGLPSDEHQIRATLYHSNGSVHYDQHAILVANLIVDPLTRVFDPAAAGTVTFEVKSRDSGTGPGAENSGDVTLTIYEAVTSLDHHGWYGNFSGPGLQRWQTAVPFTGVSLQIIWDGRDNQGALVPAGEFVAVAELTYEGGAQGPVPAKFDDPQLLNPPRRNERLAALSVGAISFNPYLGERGDVLFDLSQPAWVSITQSLSSASRFGVLPKRLFGTGSVLFPWDGFGYYWARLGAGAYPEDVFPGDDSVRTIEVMATDVPRSMVSARNTTLLITNLTVDPVAIFPRYGQVAHFEFNVSMAPAVVRAEIYVLNPDPDHNELFETDVIGGLETKVAEYVIQPDVDGLYSFDFDGLVSGSPISDIDVTVGVMLIAENPIQPGYRDVVKRLVRIQH